MDHRWGNLGTLGDHRKLIIAQEGHQEAGLLDSGDTRICLRSLGGDEVRLAFRLRPRV